MNFSAAKMLNAIDRLFQDKYNYLVDLLTSFTQSQYNDIVIPITSGKVPAVNAPTFTAFTSNISMYTFAVNNFIDLSAVEILHGYEEGTDLELHLHLAQNGVNISTVKKARYIVYYSLSQANGSYSAEASLSNEITIDIGKQDKSALYLSLGIIPGSQLKIGTQVSVRFKRMASSGTEPTLNPYVVAVGIHYKTDSMGSYKQITKR